MKTTLITLFSLLFFLNSFAQEAGPMNLTIDEAVQYALQHNKSLINAKKDVETAKLSFWETASVGLPQVNGSLSLNDNLKLMTNLIPAEMFGGPPGTFMEVQFGTQYNTGAGLTLSQLLFSGSYWVGLQTMKTLEKLSEQGLQKVEKDITEGVHNAYYLILITQETKKVLEGNLDNLKETFNKTKTMFHAGMAEQTDVDQLSIAVTMLKNTLKSMDRAIEMNYNLLKFQIGVEYSQDVNLTMSMEDIINKIDIESVFLKSFDLVSNIDYSMMNTQVELAEKGVKKEYAEVLPTLSGFLNYQQSGMGNELKELDWFPSSMIGLQLNVPIFASGQRYIKIQKAKLELEKAKTSRELVKDQLHMQENQLRLNLNTAFEKFNSEKENVDLSKRVYQSINLKYEQGIVSSLDLTQANDNYLKAQSSYISSLMELLQAKLALKKVLNTL